MATPIRRRMLFDRVTFSWTAVLAGTVAALIVQVMLTMLGLGIGLISIDSGTAADTPTGVSWAAFLYWAISGIIAAFIGGWVAGAVTAPGTGGGHALAAWAVATLVVVGAGMLAATSSASIAANLVGPTANSIARYDALSAAPADRGGATVGQRVKSNQQDVEAARRHVAGGMLGSFIALLIGAMAAFLGGRMANYNDDFEERGVAT
jgi:hypothetical protein